MRGYITVPDSISCAVCKECGARPIIAMADGGEYMVKCPNSDSHYHTEPGLIDMDDWNLNNIAAAPRQVDVTPAILTGHFFFLNGTILPAENAD